MGVNGMYGLYGVKGTPVFGVWSDNLSTRLSSTVVWMPGDFSGSAKERNGRVEEGDDAFALRAEMRCGAGRGRGATRSRSEVWA